ncbi:hypothetical protein F3Y22_tig00000773pilonHSYRG00152 [Hibiscus syriacus]|uniref:Uncharacterized protein n=1 Tax=Hibiscus syriacus TaxID=106335 RepID=A0A6A3D115_HIBSY|nr:hypothetical protein F3Y22_tig00000773pilonHSYRG00152 [Hibiscus syriacus]
MVLKCVCIDLANQEGQAPGKIGNVRQTKNLCYFGHNLLELRTGVSSGIPDSPALRRYRIGNPRFPGLQTISRPPVDNRPTTGSSRLANMMSWSLSTCRAVDGEEKRIAILLPSRSLTTGP